MAAYDVIVIGGGAVGSASARELARSGRRVLVLDPGSIPGQAWRAAAGMLAPQIEAGPGDPLLDLGLAAREHYVPLAAELLDRTGIDVGLWQEGIARVATGAAEVAELRTNVLWQQRQGHVCEWLSEDDVRRRWPWLGPTGGALWAARDAAIDPQQLVRALLADAHRAGAVIANDRAVRIDRDGDRVTGVTGQSSRYDAEQVIIAAGAWSGLLQGLPRPLPVQPIRGQMAALPWPAGIPRTIVYHKDCYLLARGSEAIIGSTMEQVGFQPAVTAAGVARIFAATILLYPNLIRAKVRRTWAGLRPVTPDGLPIIGREPLLEGLWYATGHGRNGILLAGITGLLIRQLLDGGQTVMDVQALSPTRF